MQIRRVIIESPYAGDIERNTLYAHRAMYHSIHFGEAPIAFHLLYTQPGILIEDRINERKLGIECGYAWWHASNLIVFYIDYGYSPGMIKAKDRAIEFRFLWEERIIGKNP